MRFFLKSIDVWHVIESRFKVPEKPTVKWSTVEKQTRMANGKAMNALYLAISQTEFSRISNCDSAKDAWEILETTYEGTNLVKASKLQMLVSQFEDINVLSYFEHPFSQQMFCHICFLFCLHHDPKSETVQNNLCIFN